MNVVLNLSDSTPVQFARKAGDIDTWLLMYFTNFIRNAFDYAAKMEMPSN
jgi:hypothetical protein